MLIAKCHLNHDCTEYRPGDNVAASPEVASELLRKGLVFEVPCATAGEAAAVCDAPPDEVATATDADLAPKRRGRPRKSD